MLGGLLSPVNPRSKGFITMVLTNSQDCDRSPLLDMYSLGLADGKTNHKTWKYDNDPDYSAGWKAGYSEWCQSQPTLTWSTRGVDFGTSLGY
jgi:hypothetical protein